MGEAVCMWAMRALITTLTLLCPEVFYDARHKLLCASFARISYILLYVNRKLVRLFFFTWKRYQMISFKQNLEISKFLKKNPYKFILESH